jgi:hypothetical protein
MAEAWWTEEHARKLLDAWKKSGLSMAEFARRERVRAKRLQWWRLRLGVESGHAGSEEGRAIAERSKSRARSAPASLTSFAPAVVKRAPRVMLGRAAAVTITTRTGRAIEIADATRVPASWVGAVVRELERGR